MSSMNGVNGVNGGGGGGRGRSSGGGRGGHGSRSRTDSSVYGRHGFGSRLPRTASARTWSSSDGVQGRVNTTRQLRCSAVCLGLVLRPAQALKVLTVANVSTERQH